MEQTQSTGLYKQRRTGVEVRNNEPSARLADLLDKCNLAYKTCEVYGSQVVVTCWSEKEARRVFGFLAHAFEPLKVLRSVDYAKENTRSSMNPATVEVWRAYARA